MQSSGAADETSTDTQRPAARAASGGRGGSSVVAPQVNVMLGPPLETRADPNERRLPYPPLPGSAFASKPSRHPPRYRNPVAP
jgi:hypothetical protein